MLMAHLSTFVKCSVAHIRANNKLSLRRFSRPRGICSKDKLRFLSTFICESYHLCISVQAF